MSEITDAQFQTLLDRISEAFILPDYALWRDSIELPFSLITKEGPITLRTDAELRQNYEFYMQACAVMKLDRIYRTPISLEDCGDGTWIGTYRTYLLSRGIQATAPFVSSGLLRATPEGPLLLSILHARGYHDWVGQPP